MNIKEMECMFKSDRFQRLSRDEHWTDHMTGFGKDEEEGASHKGGGSAIHSNILLAIDRDLNQRMNFNEYLMVRIGVDAWL